MFVVLISFQILNLGVTVMLYFFIRKHFDEQLQDLNFNVMVEVKRSIENLLASMREGLERSIHTIGSAWLPAAVIGGNGDSRGLRRIPQLPSIQSEASCWPRCDPIRLSVCGAEACPPPRPIQIGRRWPQLGGWTCDGQLVSHA